MTALNEIRDVSMLLFDSVPLRECRGLEGLGITQHPFVSSIWWYDNESEKTILLYEPSGFKKCRAFFRGMIYKSDLARIYLLIRKPYKLTWFNMCKEYLTPEQYGEYLKLAWIDEDNPNQDVNVTRRKAIQLFNKAEKKYLMDKDELKTYEELPKKLTVWRGVSPGRERFGLSWTNRIDIAGWFKKRFENEEKKGYILEASIDKKDILAYFDSRDEKEIVVNVNKIKNHIREI